MRRKTIFRLAFLVIAVGLLAGCSAAAVDPAPAMGASVAADSQPMVSSQSASEVPAPVSSEPARAESGAAAGSTADSVPAAESTADSAAAFAGAQSASPYKAGFLYRADFTIPDSRGLGYTNTIDYYNAYPDGQSGGTFANAGLVVHYPGDLDSDLSDADSLAYRTCRGIGLGSTRDEVFAAYGEVELYPPQEWEAGISTPEHTLAGSVMYLGRIDSGAYVTLRFYFDQNDTVMYLSYDAIYAQYAAEVKEPGILPFAD